MSGGAAPVAALDDLQGIEAAAVLCLRLWRGDGDDLGGTLAPPALAAFRALCRLCGDHGRRPLMRHSMECPCVGADEACFARLVATAAEGAREDAMLIATLIVRPDMAPSLAALAETFGLGLARKVARPLH